MIPILYNANETDFSTNGLGRLMDALSCRVTEERNGIYELELTYPVTGPLYQTMVTDGGYIGATHDDRQDVQPFKIYRFSAPLNGIVTFYAHHISYELNNVILRPFTADSLADVINKLSTQSVTANPFTFWTDKIVASSFVVDRPVSVRQLLFGEQGSILDVYGKGEYEFDKYAVKLHVNRGTDSGVSIRYGLNLVDCTKEVDHSGTYSAVAPFWQREDVTVYLPEVVVSSSAGSVAVPLDLTEKFDDPPTEQQLRTAAQSYLTNNEPWVPDENITIDFVQLWQTEEYKSVAALQRVGLCDRVSVYYEALGIEATNQEVIKVVYDTLLDRYAEMEIGKLRTTLAESISAVTRAEMGQVASVSMLENAVNRATQSITGGLGGHVVYTMSADGKPQEILVMDTEDPLTAVNVIRFNQNGIGFSRTGYNGPFTTAWTIDGSFNAQYITSGIIDGGLIRAGTISSLDSEDNEKFFLDLDNGILRMDASSLMIDGQDMSLIIQGQVGSMQDAIDDLRAHIVIGDDGSMTFIGANQNPITLRLVNDQLGIYNGGTLIDSFAADGTTTQNLIIPAGGSFSMGNFKWAPRSSGALDLVWVG